MRVRLLPGRAGTGLVIRRVDPESGRRCGVLATVAAVADVDHATTIRTVDRNGRALPVRTVEHLLAALVGLGVDNCIIEVDGDEIPILDGSAAPWVELVNSAGRKTLSRPRRVLRVVHPFSVSSGSSSMAVHPASGLRVTCGIDFAHPAIGSQEISLAVTPANFAREIAGARTFGFLKDVAAMRAAGLARGANYDNTIVLDDERVVSGPLRAPDEFVRHKAMDLVGDLALLGHPLHGHVVARRAGHRLHVEFARRLLEARDCWSLETLQAPAEASLPVALGGPASAPARAWLK